MKIIYIGPYAEVDLPDARLSSVKNGEPFEVSDAEGSRLLLAADSFKASDKAAKEAVAALSAADLARGKGEPVPDAESPSTDADQVTDTDTTDQES